MRPAAAGAVLGLALAIGAPTAWSLTRPTATAGAPWSRCSAPRRHRPPHRRWVPGTRRRRARRSPSPPVRVQVPALGVDSVVDPVGVAPDGEMAVPDDVERIGWYRFGPAPGSDGSAVLAGHVDDREQGLGALFPLRDAGVGDEVLVTDADGR